jgi:hypothetical protein
MHVFLSRLPVGALVLATAVGLLSQVGCGREIGDECKNAVDCDTRGQRTCDLSQPGGYCTIFACNETSCPSDSVCIRLFPAQFLTHACTPACEDLCRADRPAALCPAQCLASGGPVYDDCSPSEICIEPGLCAPRATERRYCAKNCGSVEDCRGGYNCRLSGTQGSEALVRSPDTTIGFCAPASSSGP